MASSDINFFIKNQLEKYFEKMKLDESEINNQSESELSESLSRINEIIEEIKPILKNNDSSAELATIILPSLLKRKDMIVNRIREAVSREEVRNIVYLVEQGSDAQLQEQIEKLVAMNEKWQTMSVEIELERRKAQEALDKQFQEIASQGKERGSSKEKRAIWKSFFERETVSTIVVAFLLIVIIFAQITASFMHINTSQILDTAFLVLLGFFFGQTIAKVSSRQRDDN